ncbi:MAG TPA: flavodoxin [Campylobacterales bacterium]|jgi:flavodoxin I|nr:flavodoxin [Campylobacterales bacterium]HHC11068.1 flavodoxin [Campylobacterales bacterium]HHD80618.1 flavodoxin [Campylobacterales bacterium]
MANIGIFYASAGGTTKIITDALVEAFDIDEDSVIFMEDDYDDVEQFDDFDVLLIGSSTWGQGDTHFEWVDPMLEIEEDADFSSKKVAFFGAGDCRKHGEHFCSALGKLYNVFTKAGATPIGFVPKEDYIYEYSLAEIDGKLCGLGIDEHNESDKTQTRVEKWIEQLKKELGE